MCLCTSSVAAHEPFLVEFKLAGRDIGANASFTVQVEPSWAPLGAQRFKELVDSGFYDGNRFFRVRDGMYDIWIAQFGVRSRTSRSFVACVAWGAYT